MDQDVDARTPNCSACPTSLDFLSSFYDNPSHISGVLVRESRLDSLFCDISGLRVEGSANVDWINGIGVHVRIVAGIGNDQSIAISWSPQRCRWITDIEVIVTVCVGCLVIEVSSSVQNWVSHEGHPGLMKSGCQE